MDIELRGDDSSAYHFSVGAVVRKDDKVAIIHKKGAYYTLPRETVYIHETIVSGLKRGAKEELGVSINLIRFLGGLITYFKRENSKTDIEKQLYILKQK